MAGHVGHRSSAESYHSYESSLPVFLLLVTVLSRPHTSQYHVNLPHPASFSESSNLASQMDCPPSCIRMHGKSWKNVILLTLYNTKKINVLPEFLVIINWLGYFRGPGPFMHSFWINLGEDTKLPSNTTLSWTSSASWAWKNSQTIINDS